MASYKYALVSETTSGERSVLYFYYLRNAKEAFINNMKYSFILHSYVCTWTKTRGLGRIIQSF